MGNIYLSIAFLQAIIDFLLDTGKPLDGCELRLFTNVVDFSVPHVLVDFTAPTYTGYALATPTLVAGFDADGNPLAVAPPTDFAPTNATNLPQVIRGALITNAAHAVIFGGNFATPITLSQAGQHFHVTAKLPLFGTAPGNIEAALS